MSLRNYSYEECKAAIPGGDYVFEPKWDGFRSIIFRDGDEVEIGSRNERPMTRYFPELVAAFRELLPSRCVIDGEIIVPDKTGTQLDFEALLFKEEAQLGSLRGAVFDDEDSAHALPLNGPTGHSRTGQQEFALFTVEKLDMRPGARLG